MHNLRLLAMLFASFFVFTVSADAHSNATALQHGVAVDHAIQAETEAEPEEHPILTGKPSQQKLVRDFLLIARAHWDQYPDIRDTYACRGIEDIKFVPVHLVLGDYGWTAYAFGDCSIRLGIEARSRKISQGFGSFPGGIGVLESCYIFVHEIGHLYGLGHSRQTLDIMHPDASPYDSWLVPGCDAYTNRAMTRSEIARRYLAERNRHRMSCRAAVETRGSVVVCNARKTASRNRSVEKWQFRMKKEHRGWSLKSAKRISQKKFGKLWHWGDPVPFDPPRWFND